MIDVAEHPATTKRRIAPYLLVGVLAVVLDALGFRTVDVSVPLGAASGLAWTLLAIPAARAVNRRGERLGWLRLPGWAGQAGLVGRLSRQVHPVRIPGAAGEQVSGKIRLRTISSPLTLWLPIRAAHRIGIMASVTSPVTTRRTSDVQPAWA
jgi:hypothetical protein